MIKRITDLFQKNLSIKNGIIFTFFATLNNGLNFLLTLILSIYLSKDDFGLLNLFLTFILILTILISLGTQSFFSVIYFKKNKLYINKILNSILIISTITLLVLIGISLVFRQQITNLLGFSTTYQILGLIICFFQLFYTTNLEVYRLEEKPIKYGVMTMAWLAINFLLTLYFCISLKKGWYGRADAQFIASIIFFVINLYYLRKNGYLKFWKPNKGHYVKTLNFGLPLIPHNSTVWIRQGFDRYIINYFFGPALLGSYSFIYNFTGLIMMVGTAFNSTNSVFIFKKLKDANKDDIRGALFKQIKIMTMIFIGITLAGIILMYLIIKLFIHKYQTAIVYIIPLSLAAFFQCIYYLFVNYLFFFNKTKTLMYITFSISVFHFALSFFITKYSVLYTAYLNLFSNCLICIFVIYYSNKTFPLFGYKKSYSSLDQHE